MFPHWIGILSKLHMICAGERILRVYGVRAERCSALRPVDASGRPGCNLAFFELIDWMGGLCYHSLRESV